MKNTLEHIMAAKKPPTIPLPKSWTKHVRRAKGKGPEPRVCRG